MDSYLLTFWPTVLSLKPLAHCVVCHRLSSSVVCDVLYCGKKVRPSQKLSEGVNRKPGSKSWFIGSPPYFYFRFRRYSHPDGHFCLIFTHTAQWSVLDGTDGLSITNHVRIFGLCGLVCRLSVCLSSATFCIVAKLYILAKNCLKEWIGNQGQKVDFFGLRHISASGFGSTATETAVFALLLPVQPSDWY